MALVGDDCEVCDFGHVDFGAYLATLVTHLDTHLFSKVMKSSSLAQKSFDNNILFQQMKLLIFHVAWLGKGVDMHIIKTVDVWSWLGYECEMWIVCCI